MTYYPSIKRIDNEIDQVKADSAICLLAEYLVEVLPNLKKYFTVHVDNASVCFVSLRGHYPRYFAEVNLDRETVKIHRYINPDNDPRG